MKTLDQYNFAGKRAVVRVDFNVPLDKDFRITDDTRIRAATPTIKKILADGGSVVLLSHLGRPKGGPENKYSLQHLVARLGQEYGQEVQFADDALQAEEKAAALQPFGRIPRIYCESDVVALQFKQRFETFANIRLIVNDENAAFRLWR